MVQYLLLPDPGTQHVGDVRPAMEPHMTPVAVGLMIGTLFVLLSPSLGRQEHRIREEHLLRAYGIGTTVFGLL